MKFEPLPKINIVDEIIKQFSESIIHKRMKASDRLPSEQELMKILGVGRSSVREALKVLEAFGLIVRKSSGNYVADPDDDFLYKPFSFLIALKDINNKDLFELRSILEASNARLAAERATPEDLAEILHWVKQGENSTNTKEHLISINIKFHMSIGRASKNVALVEVLKSMRMIFARSQLLTIDKTLDASYYHRKIYEAIKTKDSRLAADLMSQHIAKVYQHNKSGKPTEGS